MIKLASLVSPLYQPLILQVDFRSQRWAAKKTTVVSWVVLAVAADILVQFGVGSVDVMRLAGTLLTFLLLLLPPRLAVATGGLYVTQAVVSLGLSHVMQPGVMPLPIWVGYAVTYGWQLWCLVAFALLFLNYIRTPKTEFRVSQA